MSHSFDEERTLEPTARRVERMRRLGHVVNSRDLVSAFVVAAACVVAAAGGRAAVGYLLTYLQASLSGACREMPPGQAMRMGLDTLGVVLSLPLGAICVVALLSGLLQTRGSLSDAGLQGVVGRLKWRSGRLLSRDGAVDLLLDFCKLALLAAIVCWAFASCLSAAMGLHGAGASRILAAFGVLAAHMATWLVIGLLGLGLADYLRQMRRHHVRLRMTRDEAKREHRENEGIPEHKAERQLRHRELQQERADLREAVLVAVDPGRVAVAIAYTPGSREGPVLIAKGEGLLARRIETLAQVEGVAIFVDAALVHALSGVEAGDEIPESAHVPVAELMVRARRQSSVDGMLLSEGPAP